jgi:hypothetical protein
MAEKVSRWFLFGVLISLVPLFWSYENLIIKAQPATMAKIVGNGELLIIVWALCAGALGELFGSNGDYKNFKIISGGLTLIVLIAAALLFASITEARVEKANVDDGAVVYASVLLFIFSIFSCSGCIVLSEIKK